MALSVLGAVLLAAGVMVALVGSRPRAGVPAAGWFPDPQAARQRYWDSRAWTGYVSGDAPAVRVGQRFRGRFRGGWIWFLLAATAVLAAGSEIYESSGDIAVMGATSLVSMAGVGWAFYRFVARQLALDHVARHVEVVAVAVGTSGAVLLIAANVNSFIERTAGIAATTALVGIVEEGTKLLVPLLFFAVGRYRDPRAGIALGLASGLGFAITETTLYAFELATASGPDFCGTGAPDTSPATVVQAQVFRIFLVAPLHWLWTGTATAVAWRLWHLYGRRGTPGAVGAIALVMVIHSLNDSSATAFCTDPAAANVAALLRLSLLVAMYLVFRAWARKSTPPQLVGRVSRAWTPRHLPRTPPEWRPTTTQ
ncbi:PrsW family glutamic-type intramembrane protease [Promicromonospora sukumoe]|uniref:PrsW family glutamic-type intramembrane protease n=1 Tax=Promicromonospora sukumoe TaxID=88382 RepID=UPI0037C96AF1